MVVHQFLPTFLPGDAAAQAAVHLKLLLRRLGLYAELYAAEAPRGWSTLVKPAAALRPVPDDLVLYHHTLASPLTGRLLHLPCRRGLILHASPLPHLYEGAPLHEPLLAGRAQLAAMAGHVDLAAGFSDLDCARLRVAGHEDVRLLPLFIEPERFGEDRADLVLLARFKRSGLRLVASTRQVPHERAEDLLALHHELLRLDPQAQLLLLDSNAPSGLTRKARGVHWLGQLSHAERVAAYRAATAFVSMSECPEPGGPLLEAMASQVPVLAYAAGAAPSTLGGAGIAFTEKRFAALAELVCELARNPSLRDSILKGQARRLRQLSSRAVERALATALTPLIPSRPAPARRKRVRPRIAFVVQRYGEVSGGAELLARKLAHHLSPHWSVTVLTTCAKDHLTWANEFPEGAERDGPVRVLRFATVRARRMLAFNALSRQVLGRPQDRVTEERWLAEQGPLAPGLLRHLAEEGPSAYDGFVFFTYLYATAAWGLPMVARRALLVSTAHEEAPIQLDAYGDVFERPRGLVCLTPEEAAFVRRRFPRHAPIQVASVGLDTVPARPERFRRRYGIAEPYLLYVGRVEAGKGVGELLAHHAALVRGYHDAPSLVLAGAASMTVRGPLVRYLGRISEEDKQDALAGALAVVVPSRYESLSLLALEAFAQGTPVLANAESEVLAAQVRRSGAGLTYMDAASFAQAVQQAGQRRAALGKKGLAFARKHTWSQVVATYRRLMARILEDKP